MNFSKKNHEHAINNKIGVSKKSILIIATVVFGLLTTNATTLNTEPNVKRNISMTSNQLTQVYDWTVKTTNGMFQGTAPTLFEAKKRSNMVGQAEIVLDKQILSYYVLKSELSNTKNRVYYWEVESEKGSAKGFSSTEFNAQKLISLVAKGDIISYKIIQTKNK